MDHVVQRLAVMGMGLLFGGLGAVLALDFRGMARWHGRVSVGSMWWLSRLAGKTDEDRERQIEWSVKFLRVIGAVFAFGGLLIIVAAFVGHPAGSR